MKIQQIKPPQPKEGYPKTVYKYRDWNNLYHKNTLTNLELFLSSPKLFNDPYDCKIPTAYWKLDDRDVAMQYFPEMVKRHKPHLTPTEQKQEVEQFLAGKMWENEEWMKNGEEYTYNKLCNEFGVISLSHYKDDIRMWAHYASSHSGFCIGFNSEKLFFSDPDRFGSGGAVAYVPEYPVILPTDDLVRQLTKMLYIKSDIWEYEKEYRLTKSYCANQKINFRSDEVDELILGYSMQDSEIKAILSICDTNLPKVPVYKVIPIRKQFKLGFERIK